jgi:hypothetical protein
MSRPVTGETTMKMTIVSSYLLLAAASIGWGDRVATEPGSATQSLASHDEGTVTRRLVTVTGPDGRINASSLFDSSGKVEARIWECANTTAVDFPTVPCSVDPDFVLVGGGAWANGTGAGGLLTASYPKDPDFLTTWEGRSKAHGVSDPHILKVYAIGLRLSGLTRAQLLKNIYVNRKTVGPSAVPEAAALSFPCVDFCPDIYLPLGHGTFVNWTNAGTLLTRSTSNGGSAKEHGYPGPGTITHFRIGINTTIDGFGTLERSVVEKTSATVSTGPASVEVVVPSGFVPTGIGGGSLGGGVGRLLTRMSPVPTDFTRWVISSKDHLVAQSGSVFSELLTLRKKP